MRKIGGLAVLGAVVLTGCASTPSDAPASSLPEPDPAIASSYRSGWSPDEFFIVGVKMGWEGPKPSNNELVGYGESACGQIGSGTPSPVLEVSPANRDRIVEYAKAVYCP